MLYTYKYELSNHLGNVLVTTSDLRKGADINADGKADYYQADVQSANDYYAGGMLMPGRQYTSGNAYEFGFNGQLKDNDIVFGATVFEYRIHDPRIGRFLSVDPLDDEYPWNSTYAFAENRPIDGIDLEGLEYISIHEANKIGGDYSPQVMDANGVSTLIYKGTIYYWVGGTVKNSEGNIVTTYLNDNSFHPNQFDRYKNYIDANNAKEHWAGPPPHNQAGYGSQDANKHDCLTTVNRSLDKLFNFNVPIYNLEKNPAGATMNGQMMTLQNMQLAEKSTTLKFTGNSSDVKPSSVVGASLSDVPGYYYFGMSLNNGIHSVMLVVNNLDPSNPTYNIFDQHGSTLNRENSNEWYTKEKIDEYIMNYSGTGDNSKTTITPIVQSPQ